MPQLMFVVMGKATWILQSLESSTTLSLCRLGMLAAASTRHSHAAPRSDIVRTEEFK